MWKGTIFFRPQASLKTRTHYIKYFESCFDSKILIHCNPDFLGLYEIQLGKQNIYIQYTKITVKKTRPVYQLFTKNTSCFIKHIPQNCVR